ncbi:MAG: hypothetical protein AB3N17_00560, partial [Tateyamaria sp.]
ANLVAGHRPTAKDVDRFVAGAVTGTGSSEQVTAFLMAVALEGLPRDTLLALTLAYSAHDAEPQEIGKGGGHRFLDKHSTGGVGDKLTLMVLPLAAAAGAQVRKLSGTSLGHCRGTIDKLSAIPGFQHVSDLDVMTDEVRRFGFSIGRTSPSFCAGDNLTYTLRNQCGTTQVPDLIAASIMSKKLALAPAGLVLDIKVGDGGLFASAEEARRTAAAMCAIAEGYDLPTQMFLTDMTSPLGHAVGGLVEVAEALDVLSAPPDPAARLCALALDMSVALVTLSGYTSTSVARDAVLAAWSNGAAHARLSDWLAHRKADLTAFHTQTSWAEVYAPQDGWITAMNARAVGTVSAKYAGSASWSGDIRLDRVMGDRVARGDRIARIAVDPAQASAATQAIVSAVTFGTQPVAARPPILEVVQTTPPKQRTTLHADRAS